MIELEGAGGRAAAVRVLRFDGAFAPKVLKIDSGFAAEGFGGRLRRQFIENLYNRPCGRWKCTPIGGWRHHFPRRGKSAL